jgi:hypothetical protein
MAIVETKNWSRPNSEVEFYYNTGLPALLATQAITNTSKNNGSYVVDITYPDTESNLKLVQTATYSDINTLSQVDTAKGVAMDAEFLSYLSNIGSVDAQAQATKSNVQYYTLTGISSSFYCTTVYTFPVDNDPYIPVMEQSLNIAYDHKGKLADLIVGTNTLTLVHQYNNDADFSKNHFNDIFSYVPSLATKNATRTITYTEGTYTKPA